MSYVFMSKNEATKDGGKNIIVTVGKFSFDNGVTKHIGLPMISFSSYSSSRAFPMPWNETSAMLEANWATSIA